MTAWSRPATSSVGLRNGAERRDPPAGLQPGETVVAVSGTFIRGGDRVTAV